MGDSKNTSVGFVERNPVAIWGSISVLAGALLNQFAPTLSNELVTAVVEFLLTAGPTMAALVYMRLKVTPTAAPHNDQGENLVPEYVADAAE